MNNILNFINSQFAISSTGISFSWIIIVLLLQVKVFHYWIKIKKLQEKKN